MSKTTENGLVAGVILRMVKLTTPPSLTVYIVGSNPTIITVIKKNHDNYDSLGTGGIIISLMSENDSEHECLSL